MTDTTPDASEPVTTETAVPTAPTETDDSLDLDDLAWQRGADDAINIAVHLGGAFACRNFALGGGQGTAELIAIGCCIFSVVFSSFFSNVTRPAAQACAFVVHAMCILATLYLFAPQALFEGLGAFAGIVPGWMAALFGSAIGSLAATGIGDVTGD